MILLLHQACGSFVPLLQQISPYTAAYAERHGFAYEAIYGRTTTRHPYWEKLAALIDTLSSLRYDGVIYMDVDTLIARPEQPLPLLTGGCGLGMCWHPHEQLPHWNVGVVHATIKALPLLKAAWERGPIHHLWPEQMAINEEIQGRNADVACLDHSHNECRWKGIEPTWIRAWHAMGTPQERGESMARFAEESRLLARVLLTVEDQSV